MQQKGIDMKFNETLIFRILSIPSDEFNNNFLYIFLLKIPKIIIQLLIGIPIALVIDFIYASKRI